MEMTVLRGSVCVGSLGGGSLRSRNFSRSLSVGARARPVLRDSAVFVKRASVGSAISFIQSRCGGVASEMAVFARSPALDAFQWNLHCQRFEKPPGFSSCSHVGNKARAASRCFLSLRKSVACRSHSIFVCPRLGLASRLHTCSIPEGRYLCAGKEEKGFDTDEIIHESVDSVQSQLEDEDENEAARAAAKSLNVGFEATVADDSTSEHWVVNFYHFVIIDDPHLEVARHTDFLKNYDVRGRIYINEQGINAQLSSRGKAGMEYAEWVKKDSRLSELLVQISPSPEGHAFPRLKLRYKPSLVQVEGGTQHLPVTDPTARAVPLSPSEWTKRLDAAKLVGKTQRVSKQMDSNLDDEHTDSSRQVVLLDVRNGYEWDVGHFKGAQRPNVDCFKSTAFGLVEEEDARDDPLADVDKEKVDVLMYCTGGIRCDVYSTMLRAKGFKNLYSLKGGISNYLKEEGSKKWAGNLFVFDSRLAVPPKVYHENPSQEGGMSDDSLKNFEESRTDEAFARCRLCGDHILEPRHRNCANLDCNQLYLTCDECLAQYKGCCSDECSSAPKLRPLISRQQYERWHNYRPTEPASPKPADYVSRRAMKRRRRKERRKELMNKAVCEEEEPELLVQNA
ncbi:hypothetical protein Mapa_000664 [Marchantia paleacea]|nr:hypothetical protein Mapa_000664 [Marchantia paleacea]